MTENTDIGNVRMVNAKTMLDGIKAVYTGATPEDMDIVKSSIKDKLKTLSKSDVFPKWYTGEGVTEEAFKEISKEILPADIKRYTITVPTYIDPKDKSKGLKPSGEWTKIKMVRSISVGEFLELMENGKLTEEKRLNFVSHIEGLKSIRCTISAGKNILNAEKKTIEAELHARAQEAANKELSEAKLRTFDYQTLFKEQFEGNEKQKVRE